MKAFSIKYRINGRVTYTVINAAHVSDARKNFVDLFGNHPIIAVTAA